MTDLAQFKTQVRKAAFSRRKAAFDRLGSSVATRLTEVLAPYQGLALAGYMPIRSEISPLGEMGNHHGTVCVPVIQAAGRALLFAQWTPDMQMVDGPFGAKIPADFVYVTPEVLIVPLVAFDQQGNRLGYGGGFYDRTLEQLRKSGSITAIGFAFEDQCADSLPMEPTDQPLDFIVTDAKVRKFSAI